MNDDHLGRLALVKLPGMGPARAAWLLGGGTPAEMVEMLRRGRLPGDLGPPPPGVTPNKIAEWQVDLRNLDLASVLATQRELGVSMIAPRDDRWPFAGDPEPPILLFARGDVDLLDEIISVAVVGTRRCTGLGRTVAYRLGRDVARAGGVVVSGLALGVDGAAHRGALDHQGGVIGVVGSGLDVVYPKANRSLWDDVATNGLLLSEAPIGSRPDRWRFPARNRIIAALSEAVVVVESHHRGGALSTADEAIHRGRPVMAVPGSVLSAASDGTNALLVDGAVPVRDAFDVLEHLGHEPPPHPDDDVEPTTGPDLRVIEGSGGRGLRKPGGNEEDQADEDLRGLILAEVATGPVHADRLVQASGRSIADVMVEVQRLHSEGRIELDGSTVSQPGQSR